jgi:biotin carboxylase
MRADGRIALVMHTTGYGLDGFVAACRRVGAEPLIASDRCPVLDHHWQWPDDALAIDFGDLDQAAADVAAAARAGAAPVRAVLPVGGEVPAQVAARAAGRLGLPANEPAAMAAAGNKLAMRQLCASSPGVRTPRFVSVPLHADPAAVAADLAAPGGVGFPCVLKPLLLSGSRGVMRADDAGAFQTAFARLRALLSAPALLDLDPVAAREILIESFVPGPEVALEGLLSMGELQVLALFDKPDPLDGPFFEETIYVTPSRLPVVTQAAVARAAEAAARAMGLRTGPVHAELRLGGGGGPVPIEVAARPIGGLCARALRFSGGLTLEELVVRHALGEDVRPLARERRASGVMMIPIPAREPGVLRAVGGVEAARAVPGVEEVVITIRVGETVVPLPEGASYLGFLFARGDEPAAVEAALREAHARLAFTIAPLLPVAKARG